METGSVKIPMSIERNAERGTRPMNACQQIDQIIANHGHAEPVMHLAALVGWQARYASRDEQPQIAEAVRLLTAAAEILSRLEAKEDAERGS